MAFQENLLQVWCCDPPRALDDPAIDSFFFPPREVMQDYHLEPTDEVEDKGTPPLAVCGIDCGRAKESTATARWRREKEFFYNLSIRFLFPKKGEIVSS